MSREKLLEHLNIARVAAWSDQLVWTHTNEVNAFFGTEGLVQLTHVDWVQSAEPFRKIVFNQTLINSYAEQVDEEAVRTEVARLSALLKQELVNCHNKGKLEVIKLSEVGNYCGIANPDQTELIVRRHWDPTDPSVSYKHYGAGITLPISL